MNLEKSFSDNIVITKHDKFSYHITGSPKYNNGDIMQPFYLSDYIFDYRCKLQNRGFMDRLNATKNRNISAIFMDAYPSSNSFKFSKISYLIFNSLMFNNSETSFSKEILNEYKIIFR